MKNNEVVIRNKIDKCLKHVTNILTAHKAANIKDPNNVNHNYNDKYLLSEFLTKIAIGCSLNALSAFINKEQLLSLHKHSKDSEVSLKFISNEKCKYVKTVEKEIESPRVETERTGVFGTGKTTTKVITKVKEYVYEFTCDYEIVAYQGVGNLADGTIQLMNRSCRQEIVIRSDQAPYKETNIRSFDVNISWLLRHCKVEDNCFWADFTIDRTHKDCYTPYRNVDVAAARDFFIEFPNWCNQIDQYFVSHLFQVQLQYSQLKAKPDVASFSSSNVFNPVVPMFEERNTPLSEVPMITTDSSDAGNTSLVRFSYNVSTESATTLITTSEQSEVVLPARTVNSLLEEQLRSLEVKWGEVSSITAGATEYAIISAAEAKLVAAFKHVNDFAVSYCEAAMYIESMIRAQVVSAVGKELQASDFGEYMVFHNRKILKEHFQPKPFSFSVRRSPSHSPEGLIRIEQRASDGANHELPASIYTVCQHSAAESNLPMQFPLNASTNVHFGGDRYVHGWLAHRFSGQPLPQLQFVSQARQFSSYIVLIGRIASAKVFLPKFGFIAQNKDEFTIPLDLEQIPTAKEFKDAIQSLSPEQQRFAKAFRSMQLESTLFGVCVIQIKPQLEKVLNLPPDSLTKEIRLTQDLMELFIKYQISSDLLSYDDTQNSGTDIAELGAGSLSTVERVSAVKKHVAAMRAMIEDAQKQEIEEKNKEREYLHGLKNRSAYEERSEVLLNSLPIPCSAPAPGGGNFMLHADSQPVRNKIAVKKKKNLFNSAPMRRSQQMETAPASVQLQVPKVSQQSQQLENNQVNPTDNNLTEQIKTQDFPDDHSAGMDTNQQLIDYTQIPTTLDSQYEKLDVDNALHPTIINPGSSWQKKAQAALLAKPTTRTLQTEDQTSEKDAAFDLLDALTRSGAIALEDASLHVVIAATHCFDRSLMDTVVQRNVNPIERVERSTLIMASTLHGLPTREMLLESQVDRVRTFSPMLFEAITDGSN